MTRSTRRLNRIGVQIYSLRDAAARDLDRTLADIAAIGYTDVEMLGSSGNFGTPPLRVRQMLDRHGLRAPSTHIASAALDDIEKHLDDAELLGHDYLVVASVPTVEPRTVDHYRHWADRMNEAGLNARARNRWIGFHNHADDLVEIDGVVPYDVLLDRTDPTVVRHQLDTGNIAMAGRDPQHYLERYGPRYFLFHLKDVDRSNAMHDVELGHGIVDFRRILASTEDIDEKLFFIEQETSSTSLESLRRAYSYMTTLDF
jgi:sugar phosphate isomerase/epimerase